MKEPSPRRLACIDVGSGALNLLIVEMHKDRLRVLDELSKSVALGRDCFSTGSIQRATTRETCEILLGFRALLNEYKVDECRVVATSALREAANRDWVVDQIRVSTGFQDVYKRQLPRASRARWRPRPSPIPSPGRCWWRRVRPFPGRWPRPFRTPA